MFYTVKYTMMILYFGLLISIEILCTSFNQRVLIVRYFYINSRKNNNKKKGSQNKTKKNTCVSLYSEENYSWLKNGGCSYPLREKSNGFQGLLRTSQV